MLRIGSRGSRLALTQTHEVIKKINAFDDKIKCIVLQSFPINEFVICSENEYQILKYICNFEYSIEDEIWEIKNNPYTSVIDLTTDDFNNTKSLTIWIRKYLSKLGVNLKLNRENIESNYLNYKILSYDINEFSWYKSLIEDGIDLRIEDIFDWENETIKKEFSDFIVQDGVTLVLCD